MDIFENIDSQLKTDMDRIANGIGLTTADAVRVFMKQFVAHKGFPFDVVLAQPERYNAETMQAMHDAKNEVDLTPMTRKEMREMWESAK
ncbi:MAG: type II toxin-antitoxin system RelB/DinJ family antitoxin [Spirochaetes bacterium]|nr:type II toxin-antitoxin system RelB/DinJ family antitoxin [Spirochaetota bacterium]